MSNPQCKTPTPTSPRVSELTLVWAARQMKIDLTWLRDRVLQRGESWPPRQTWFEGYCAALNVTL